ncbi:MAG: hypothetical protein ACK4N5_08145 [Myxococcales bacterium]
MKTIKCPACGEGTVAERQYRGRRMPYRHIPDLEVPEQVAIPECDACHEQFIGGPVVAALDEALAAQYARALRAKAETAIGELKKRVTQRELESLLGLSAGYLSKVKGDSTPSAVLVAALLLLAEDPARVDELERGWAVGGGRVYEFHSFSRATLEPGPAPIIGELIASANSEALA